MSLHPLLLINHFLFFQKKNYFLFVITKLCCYEWIQVNHGITFFIFFIFNFMQILTNPQLEYIFLLYSLGL